MTHAAAAPWRRPLDGWRLCSTAPGQCAAPSDLSAEFDWVDVTAAGTVASMLREAGRWSLDTPALRVDACDWWLSTQLVFDPVSDARPTALHLEGLAGLADVWVNGQHLLHSGNMYIAHVCALGELVRPGSNRIDLRFSSLDAALAQRRPRPRWRAPMVEHQQLRWFRQTTLGRTPGWTPPAAPVGPWRAIWVECGDGPPVREIELHSKLLEEGVGSVTLSLRCLRARRVELRLTRTDQTHAVVLQTDDGDASLFQGQLRVESPALWWPHTHGDPALYAARLRVEQDDGATFDWPLPALGFRRLTIAETGGDFELKINGVAVFCRGACWMPVDPVTLRCTASAYAAALAQVRDAGMNMLRISGATVYEDRAFFEACDAAGVMVWQDFMFANMDYPGDDPSFAASVRDEAAQQLGRWGPHACLAIVCGNSEVEQQAAMWGAPRALWSPPLFHALLRECVQARLPHVPYWPSSAHGGAFPHQADRGTTSYYGVGAYLRPLDDARRARPRFATECLGLANVPDAATLKRMPQGAALRVHHPAWKARAPRDLGAGWDFEDVRDHYLQRVFDVDALRCRYSDHERYLELSRAVSGEVMAAAYSEWRRPGSGCRGALVWFLRDLWAGAGWGLLDDAGRPKPCWWWLRRVLQPRALLLTDEGLNGLDAHLINERGEAQEATLHVDLFGQNDARLATAQRCFSLARHDATSVSVAELFDGFHDLSWSYRFGPAAVRAVHARWNDAAGEVVAEAFHFPAGQTLTSSAQPGLTARVLEHDRETLRLRIEASSLVHSLHIDVEGWMLSDNYFHLAPGSGRDVLARAAPGASAAQLHAWLRPLNAAPAVALRWPD